ncbi:50S ribosomal protein L30 [Candidatus Micropelagos thuwalensis]|jgi:small subunit ribosomal protein S8|uniref:Small ribosomal subunit protein uS8 n=1 Tax=Candidatus Micropelagius thuwalensis TaxID=1397666 RepID=U2XWB2_9PROT|nr:30S ribosomal protein S8 [Candidatus Micropelagos thuwalensis]MEC6998532.1 30S ribosomal protein S8 [Pseudomonadota bacterium]ERL47121.1 50S ribosomal protein L30 [Candidatus Micropelagos thuwalensis]MDP6222940.1 30S ribosomal protein S8 [Candidatus Micropelagos thuwalensis]MEC7091939.1 30S ribosomal protein S8 [Pseudomonadota bacterium]MEC7177433.1 30S ribosomal protein S8 [Pseudomonadota bacterium]|tara:strand:+ start:590 stop:988 length:399 start_codon:yes stop_codon:yes gene_type:complete
MNLNDPLGDMLTRIRNAQMRGKSSVVSPSSKLRRWVLDVLKDEGYIRGYSEKQFTGTMAELEIELKYHEGRPVIQDIQRVSKPGRRVYSSVKTMPVVQNGLGISILSTPKGVMSDSAARENNVGGEVLCRIF